MPAAGASTWIIQSVDVGPTAAANSSSLGMPLYNPFTTLARAEGAEAVNRSSVAALAFLVWDMLITFDDEVKYIWPRKWTYTKYVYFVARYLPVMVETSILLIGSELTPLFHFSSHDCYIWQVFQGVSAAIIITTVDTILILRVHALYHGNYTVRIIVTIFFTFEVIGMISGLALAIPGIEYDEICLVTKVPKTLMIYGAASIIFQTVMFSLTVYKFARALRSGWGHIPLVKLLIRDGTWAFILLFVMMVSQLGLYGLKNHAYAGVLYGWLLTAFSFCGYRILLNINRLGEPHIVGGDGHAPHQGVDNLAMSVRTGTNIEFTTQILDSYESDDNVDSVLDIGTTRGRQERGWRQKRSYQPRGNGDRVSRRDYYQRADDDALGRGRTFDIETSQISTISLGH